MADDITLRRLAERYADEPKFKEEVDEALGVRRVVHRVEDDMDRQTVEATTYQMRNPFKQLRDGFFTTLDVFNYMHHHHIAKQLVKRGDWVLDVCCGRGIMLPLLRYHNPDIAGYVGVDIEPKNAEWLTKRVTDGKYLAEIPTSRDAVPVGEPDSGQPFTYTRETYYPFPTFFVESNVAEMAEPVAACLLDALPSGPGQPGVNWAMPGEPQPFTMIIYTQSIEHMHPDAGHASLEQCAKLAAPGARMIISGPNTPDGMSGYETRYRAHVYEWKRTELLEALAATGWDVQREWGLTMGKRALAECMADAGLSEMWNHLSTTVPTEWLVPVLSPLFPQQSDEVAILASRGDGQLRLEA